MTFTHMGSESQYTVELMGVNVGYLIKSDRDTWAFLVDRRYVLLQVRELVILQNKIKELTELDKKEKDAKSY